MLRGFYRRAPRGPCVFSDTADFGDLKTVARFRICRGSRGRRLRSLGFTSRGPDYVKVPGELGERPSLHPCPS